MVAADQRRNFIFATARGFFGISNESDLSNEEISLVDKFLDNARCRSIYAISQTSTGYSAPRVMLTDQLPAGVNTLVFFKIRESRLTEENIHEVVQVSSLSTKSDLVAGQLAETLLELWAPVLREFAGLEPVLLSRLRAELLGPRACRCLADEEACMRDKIAEARDPERYETAAHALKEMRREIESAAQSREGLLMVEETLDSISGHLDDLWKLKGPVYDEQRMQSLLEIIGSEIAQTVKALISKMPADSRSKDEAISHGATICEKWVEMSARMTGLFWPHHDSHTWKDKPYKPERCSNFETRLKEIAEIRAQNRQLTRLLSPSERTNLGTDTLFQDLDAIEDLLGEEHDAEWIRLKDKVSNGLGPAEERVAAKLRAQLTGARTPLGLESEFRRYSELMSRRAIKSLLMPERQALLAAYSDLIDACQTGPDTNELLDTPEVLQKVQAARVSELRLESLHKLGKQLLFDLPGYEDISLRLKTALDEAKEQRQELIEIWVNTTRESVLNNDLSLSRDATVVELTSAGLMRVNFEPRLTALIREARGLAALGVELPREVKDLVERASSLTGRARALQQVANFHNTIDDRVIPAQRPIVHAAALELGAAVREQANVAWSNPRAIDAFTNRLREMVKKFARQNAELATKHAILRDMVCNLLKSDAINLAVNQNAWKDTLRNMREIVSSVDAVYKNTDTWKLHWDRQLLKALGIAYRAALPTLLKKLPEIRVELTYRDESLQWRPSLEDIRTKLYSGIRRFLVIPVNFRGVGDQAKGRFDALVPQSAHLFGSVYKEAEILLEALESLRVKWMPLVAPAKIDTGRALKGKQPQDWEKAFKDAKLWAQEVGKLRVNEIKISCVTVDTGTIRNDLESLSRRYWERLALDLRAEASSRLVSIVDFLSSSTRKLSQRARTIEEIGDANEAYTHIQTQSSEIARELEDVSGLGRVLAAWTRERLEGLSNAHTAWDTLKERLDNYNNVMSHQMEEVKLNLRHQVLALQDEQERWKTRWSTKPEVMTRDWIETMRETWTNLSEQRDTLTNDCKRLGLSVQEMFEDDEAAIEKMESELEAEELNCRYQGEFIEELKRHEEEEWSVARRRLPKLHDWLDSWQDRIRLQTKNQQHLVPEDSTMPEESAKLEAHSFIGKRITELREAIENVQLLRGDELAEEHWNELREILHLVKVRRMSDLTLGHLIENAHLVKDNAERIKDVTKRAAAESGIRQALTELEAWESYTSLPIQEVRDSKNQSISIVGDYSSLLARASELRLILDGAKGATGYERFSSRAARCEAALFEVAERIRVLSIIQRKWIYLEPVYSSGAAPSDSGRWARADKEFRYFMAEIAKDPKIPSLKRLSPQTLANLKELMDRCQKSLDDFLEEKRSAYPRLYFLSDEDLLELVSGKGLDAHLSKLYQGVGAIGRNDDNTCITCVVSPEGERLKLVRDVDLSEVFPQWLINLEESIETTLKQNLTACLSEQTPDVSSYPTQILLLCERIRFTERCERTIEEDKMGLQNLLYSLDNQRELYRSLEDSKDQLISLKAKNLLLETVHHLHIVQSLLDVIMDKEKLRWNWNRQLRTYLGGKGPTVKCAKAEFSYRFEYQGAAVGLVSTELTEKCYLALTQAMKLGLGGSPTGPAGTGKTESVKALGSILGRRVLVFNCDEGMDSGSMRRILSGLAQAGAWGCFDEFNRLEEGTMSAVAMLIRPLQEAIRDGAAKTNLGGIEIPVDPHCCLFITMNPAGDDYGGRRKLPDSLARLFRPIGMAHPNKTSIVRSLLECSGFLNAPVLANKLVETFDTAEKLLSKQPHYDWGLRALRSVLDAIPSTSKISGEINEDSRMLTGIKTATIPKLTESDLAKFSILLNDVFSKSKTYSPVVVQEKEKLQNLLINLCEKQELHDSLVSRCEQLNDQLKTRSGVAIVGPPGSGKSLIIKILGEALSETGTPVKQFRIHPGAIRKSKLLGSVDQQTREFKEGLISNIICNNTDQPIWIIFDGDVEPEWAEALNSALDDNRIMTLPNGVGIKLGTDTRFIFETHKLSGASPATVSRLGVVYLGPILPSILLRSNLFEKLSAVSLNFAKNHLCMLIDQVLKIKGDQKSASCLLHGTLQHLEEAHTQTSCVQALLASICGQIEDVDKRDDLARDIYQLTNIWCPDSQNPCDVLYDKLKDALDPFVIDSKTVQTESGPVLLSGSIQRGINSTLPWVSKGQAVIFRGPTGCGKKSLLSVILASVKNMSDEAISVLKISSLYGTKDLISRLKRSCIKLDSSSGGRVYKPRNGSSLILVIEDLHLASKDLQELIRQLIQDGGFYEDDLEFARVPLTILSTSDTLGKLHPRLDSLLASHYMTDPKPRDLDAIIDLHLNEAMRSDDVLIKTWIAKMSPTVMETFNEISNEKSWAKWTTKDLIGWIDSLRFYPIPEDEIAMTNHLIDASKRYLKPRLTLKQQKRIETIISSRSSTRINFSDNLYISKSAAGLIALPELQWRAELENAVMRIIRDGETLSSTVSSYLLEISAGISWGLGCEQRGILLSGRSGAGRKSATKIVSVYSSMRLIDSGPGKGRAAVKNAVQTAGVDGEPTLLLFEEHHLRDEDFCILASAIVSNGELPGLYSSEELDGLVAPLADLAAREEFSGNLEQFLYYRLRKYLRVVLIVDSRDLTSPRLSSLRHHCIQTTGQCLGNEWWISEGPLTELANLYRDPSKDPDDALSGVSQVVQAHLNAPNPQQAPARYLALLAKWKDLRDDWLRDIEAKLKSLHAGIDRLQEAGDRVAKLEEDATEQRRQLEIERGRANAALEKITATMRGATGQRGEMASLKSETERESIELGRRKADIEGELGKVKPLVEQAAQAVAGISAEALSEVRSLRAPPAPVRDVLEGVLRLMGIRDTSWNSMKTFLSKRGIKEEIRNWDARRSQPASLEAVAKLVKERPDSFEEKTARRASVAAAPLAAWVLANLQYGQILQQVAPLEREQRVLGERLSAAEAQIGKLESGLSSVESKVAQLQEELAAHSRGAAELQLRSEATEASLATARALLAKLDAEHTDWQTQLKTLTDRKNRIGIEAADAALLLTYQYPWRDEDSRKRALDQLVSEREVLQWRAQGLPSDTESLVGAARALRGLLVPLFVDPSGIAVAWLRRHLGESRLEVTRPGDARFLTSVELAVRFGKPLLVEDLNDIPGTLLPLLRGRPLRMGERSLVPQQGFRLFLATRRRELLDSLPYDADDVLVKISLGAGSRSFAERLVDEAILQETPEVEGRRREALEREEQLQGEIEAARLDLLVQLGAARSQDILQESGAGSGGGLLASLELTQRKAREIERALQESRSDLEEINKRCRVHDRLAKFTAVLYKFVSSLSALSSLYVFDMETLSGIFLEVERGRGSLHATRDEKDKLLEKTIISLTLHHCTKAVYRKHRLPLALHLALSLSSVPEEQRNLLLSGENAYISNSTLEHDVPNFIPPEQKSAIRALISGMPEMKDKLKSIWASNIANIHSEEGISSFEKLVLIKALHPEHLHTALSKWASQQLGVRSLTPPSWTLKQISEENERRPILLLLAPGADPEPELSSLVANQTILANGFTEISLGQGHVGQAESALELACKQGSWILLSNLQLALNWLPRLETILRSPICTVNRNPNTRIWLTTEECTGFYSGLSGLCLKLAYEPPEGVKRNVKRSLQQLLQRQAMMSDPRKSLMISWLHAILQERRKFVPQGWTKAYSWSEAELEAACELVVKATSTIESSSRERSRRSNGTQARSEDWEAERGILDAAIYGGLLQDEFDGRVLKAILRQVWCSDAHAGRRKLGEVLSVPRASSENPLLAIDKLDDTDSLKAYFGLPANAHCAWEKCAGELALRYLMEISRKSAKTKKDTGISKSSSSNSRTLNELKQSIEHELRTGESKLANDSDDPLQKFFADEANAARQLLRLARSDIENSRSSDDLKTPAKWMSHWSSGPKDMVPFVGRLISRHKSLGSLLSGGGLPGKVELSWFARPDAFLAALKQYTARRSDVAFESLRLHADWASGGSKNNWSVAVLVDGLVLTGARIENGVLEEVSASASSVMTAPSCLIAYADDDQSSETNREEGQSEWGGSDIELTRDLSALQVPVYTDSFRTHLICSLPVPYVRDQRDNWHQRGISFHLRST